MQLVVQIGLVALGSALGGVARWGVTMASVRFLGTTLWGTLFVNLTGSLFLGWFITLLLERLGQQRLLLLEAAELRLLLAVGFTGAYTTFSTYEYEAHDLLHDGDGLRGTAYLLGSVLLGLLAVRVGVWLARLM